MSQTTSPTATILKPGRVDFSDDSAVGDKVHLLEAQESMAINAAIAAGRPLLVRGEPGIGKSQLARAAAKALNRAFVSHVIDAHTESRDLMWSFDAVSRLAEAQLAGAVQRDTAKARAALKPGRFLHPGPLWWVLDWEGAAKQSSRAGSSPPPQMAGCDWRNGCVLLLDEIDKAESELPNGLLEALGARQFTPFGHHSPVKATGPTPLVIITTNEERALPDAFLRRCLVLHLTLPKNRAALIEFLVARGKAHFPGVDRGGKVLLQAATMLADDRAVAQTAQIRPYPGQAEYLDLLRATFGLAETTSARLGLLQQVRRFALQKAAFAGQTEAGELAE